MTFSRLSQRFARYPATAVAAALIALAHVSAQAQTPAPAPVHPPASSEQAHGVIIKLKAEANTSTHTNGNAQRSLARLTQVFQGMPLPMGAARATGGTDTYLVQWERPLSRAEVEQLLGALRAHPAVQWASPNVMEQALQVAPNDPAFASDQWWLSASPTTGSRGVPNIAQAWARSTGSSVNVAVLDTGLLRSHPDLLGSRFDTGYDLVGTEGNLSGDGDGRDPDFSDPGDGHIDNECPGLPAAASTWHGSGVASQIGALTNNGVGVAGINWQSRIVSVRVARKCGALTTTVVDGLRWAAGLQVPDLPLNPYPARIINLSFGSPSTDCQPYQDTLDELRNKGVLVVAASGDSDRSGVYRPARCPGALAVSALNRDGFKARYASFGPEVGISTVGGDRPDQSIELDPVGYAMSDTGLVMAGNDGVLGPGTNGQQTGTGTSFSAPIVAGVASLMLSVNPSLTLDQLVYGLQVTARPHVNSSSFSSLQTCNVNDPKGRCYCTTSTCGAGILDAASALAYAANPGAYGNAPPFGVNPATPSTPAPSTPSSSGSGGGALGGLWLLMLGLLVAALGLNRFSRQSAHR